MSILHSVLAFVFAIGVLVTVHEFGHFWVARRLGVKVLRFSIGFGRPLWTRRGRVDGTEYVVAAIPLGGYVKMLDEREDEVAEDELDRAFNRQALWKRIAIVSAGPAFNFLFAIVAYWAMFVVGVSGPRPIVQEVAEATPAAVAGLRAGDEIVAIDGQRAQSWDSVIQAVVGEALDGGRMALTVRGAEGVERDVTLSLAGTSVDDLTRGQFFDSLGLQPARVAIPAVLGSIESGSPAARAGLGEGDEVLACDGQPVPDWGALVECIRANPGQALPLEVRRGELEILVEVTPKTVEEGDSSVGRIGAGVRNPQEAIERFYVVERLGPLAAVPRALRKTAEVVGLTTRMLWKMVTFQLSVENLSGPISIAQYAGVSAEIGVARFLDFLALVSVSLGLLNLLPVPVLDGGHLLYYLIELVRGRPLSEQAQYAGQRIGIALLVGLMGLAFYNDIVRLFS